MDLVWLGRCVRVSGTGVSFGMVRKYARGEQVCDGWAAAEQLRATHARVHSSKKKPHPQKPRMGQPKKLRRNALLRGGGLRGFGVVDYAAVEEVDGAVGDAGVTRVVGDHADGGAVGVELAE